MSNEKMPGEPGRIRRFMEADHRRLEKLLDEMGPVPDPHGAPYRAFRLGLLKHIAIEEKILRVAVREALGGPFRLEERLRADHSLIATLLIPTPTPEILSEIREVLESHNVLEEGPDGFYHQVERLAGSGTDELMTRIEAFMDPKPARHADTRAVQRQLQGLRAARSRWLERPGSE